MTLGCIEKCNLLVVDYLEEFVYKRHSYVLQVSRWGQILLQAL